MPSIEALAMAGADCNECEIHLEDVEKRHTIYKTRPQYLLADDGTSSGEADQLNLNKKGAGGVIRKLSSAKNDIKQSSDKIEDITECLRH